MAVHTDRSQCQLYLPADVHIQTLHILRTQYCYALHIMVTVQQNNVLRSVPITGRCVPPAQWLASAAPEFNKQHITGMKEGLAWTKH